METEEKKDTLCLKCKHEWKSRFPPKENPYFDRTQCPRCYGYTAVIKEEYQSHLDHLKQRFSTEDIQKFRDLYKFAVDNGYVRAQKSRHIKVQKLLDELAKPTQGSLLAELKQAEKLTLKQ